MVSFVVFYPTPRWSCCCASSKRSSAETSLGSWNFGDARLRNDFGPRGIWGSKPQKLTWILVFLKMFEDGWWCLKLIEDVWWLKMLDWTWLMMLDLLDMFEVVWEFEGFKILSWWLMRWRECLKKMRSRCLEMVEVGSRLLRCQKKLEDGWECWKFFLRIIQDGFRDAFRDAWRCCLKLEECHLQREADHSIFGIHHPNTVKPLNR